MKLLHFLDVGKVVTLLSQKQNVCALEIFNHNSHRPHLSAERNFWRYSISAGNSVKGKIEILTFSGWWKSGNVAIAKEKCLCTRNCAPQQPHSSSFSQKNVFENLLNTFEDIAFLPENCKGKNWNFYIFWMMEKW